MTTLTTTLVAICSGGNHLTFSITGDKAMTIALNLNDLSDPIADEDVQTFARIITRMAKNGRTNSQARTLLQAGVTVTV